LPAMKELAGAHKIGLNGHSSARDLHGKKKELEANSPRSKTRADLDRRRRAARDGNNVDLQTSVRRGKQTRARKRKRKGAVTSQPHCEARQNSYEGSEATNSSNQRRWRQLELWLRCGLDWRRRLHD
jgi:hypothetical protein